MPAQIIGDSLPPPPVADAFEMVPFPSTGQVRPLLTGQQGSNLLPSPPRPASMFVNSSSSWTWLLYLYDSNLKELTLI